MKAALIRYNTGVKQKVFCVLFAFALKDIFLSIGKNVKTLLCTYFSKYFSSTKVAFQECSLKKVLRQIHRKTSAMESLFSRVVGLGIGSKVIRVNAC